MSKVGSLHIDLALQSAQFIAGLKQAQAATTQAATKMTSTLDSMKGIVKGFAGVLTVDYLQGQVQSAFDYADAIVDLGARTGATTTAIQEFRYAAQMTGSDFETADKALEKFSKNIGSVMNGNDAMAAKFKELGVTSRDFDTALRQTIEGISKLPSVAQRNAAAFEIFGKSATTLTALMGEGADGFDTLAQRAASLGIVIEDDVLQAAGQFNDQLDTTRMILDAQMANMIIRNVDAIVALGDAFTSAGSAAAGFITQMRVARLMSTQQNDPFAVDIVHTGIKRLQGKSYRDIQDEDRNELKSFGAGRNALFEANRKRYNDLIRQGRSADDPVLQAIKAENDQIVEAHVAARRAGRRPIGNGGGGTTLPTPKGKPSPKKTATPLVEQGELDRDWRSALLRANSANLSAQMGLVNDPTERFNLSSQRLRNDWAGNLLDIEGNTGTDQQVREGKKRYTQAQAIQLKLIEQEIFDAEFDALQRDRDETLANDRLDLAIALNNNSTDELYAQQALAQTAKERRDLSLKMIDNQFAQERLQNEAIVASKSATDAEKKIAEARLRMLPGLKTLADEGAKRATESPMEAYLNQIPKTGQEINEAVEKVGVEGLQSLEDGLMGVIDGTKSVGEAFTDMSRTIINGLIKIGLQQMIIKPLGGMLFGGGEGGGGGLFGSILGGITGKRANGGLTRPGTYLMGERGEELVTVGANAHVTANNMTKGSFGGGQSVNVSFGNITSNDPAMVKAMALEAAMQMAPLVREQAVNATMSKLKRPRL